MNPRYSIHEEIDRYLNGQMAAAERRAFEEQLASNPSLRADFEAQQVAHQIIIEDSLLDLKKQMQRDMNGGGSAPTAPGRGYRNLWIGLGGGILCFSVFYYLISSREKENKSTSTGTTVTQQTTVKKDNAVITTPQNQSTGSVALTPAPIQPSSKENTLAQSPSSVLPVVNDQPTAAPIGPAHPAPDLLPATTPRTSTQPTTTPASTPPAPDVTEHDQGGIPPQGGVGPGDNTAFVGTHTFQPDVEGTWTIPLKENTSGTVRIIGRSGVTVYQTHFSSGTTLEWNGNDAAGIAAPGGYYIFLIEYEQGRVEKGSLSILR